MCQSTSEEIPNIKELRIVNMYSVNNTMSPVVGFMDMFDLRSNHIMFDITSNCYSIVWFSTLVVSPMCENQ